MDVMLLDKRVRVDDPAPPAPSKPTDKRVKASNEAEGAEVSNKTILEAILKLEKRADEPLADLSVQSKHSSTMIASLAKAVQFNTEEMKECKQKVQELEKRNEQLCKENNYLKEIVKKQECYRMRWCLHITGLVEKKR